MKNALTARCRRVMKQAEVAKLLITATPIQNSVGDLQQLLAIAVPSARWPAWQDFVLRRSGGWELPTQHTTLLFLHLLPAQRAEYDAATRQSSGHVFTTLSKQHAIVNSTDEGASAKLRYIKSWLATLAAAGEKTIVVSGRLSTLDAVSSLSCHKLFRLDGRCSVAERERVVRAFQECSAPATFLLSKSAGALGLTLTSACHLLICEPSWNPTWDAQAAGRINRPGQSCTCHIVRLFGADSVEEDMWLTQLRKHEQAQVLSQGMLEEYCSVSPPTEYVKKQLVSTVHGSMPSTEADCLAGPEPPSKRARLLQAGRWTQ